VAYLPGFEEDVFISYAHNDDDTYGLEPRGWVAQLHLDLKQRVKVFLGATANAEPSLWRDCEIRTFEDFAKKISNRLARTGTFLSIISPSSIHREWCVRELEEFTSSAERNLGIRIDDEKWRIFKIEKVPVDQATWPPHLQQGNRSYKFHGPDPRDGEEHEFRPLLGGEYGVRYFEEMDALARDIATVLRELTRKAKSADVAATATAAKPGLAVYVAEPTSDMEKEASAIRRDLTDRGYLVLPSGDLPYRASDFRNTVRDYLTRSVLSVHLVGKEYGIISEGEVEKSNAWLQNDLAVARGAEVPFPRLVWVPGDTKPTDARQQRFVRYLLEDAAAQNGADIFTTGLEDLKTNLQRKLDEIRRQGETAPQAAPPTPSRSGAAAPAPHASDEPLRVYVICDQLDRKSPPLLAMNQHLFEQGYEPILPSDSEDEREALREHADNLAICDACVIYYGQGSDRWFATKLGDFRKVLSRRQTPVRAKAIYLAPPDRQEKKDLRTHEAIVLQGSETFSPDSLTPLLTRLAGKAGGARS
jgi:hypothetical protein